MSIASRTPEGQPHRCSICGNTAALEFTSAGDACCPSCGSLLWWFRNRLSSSSAIAADQVSLSTSFVDDVGANSLDQVELVMELEEEFGIDIPDEVAERMRTVGDVIRYVRAQRGE